MAQAEEVVRKAEGERALATQRTAVAESKLAELQRALENAEERARPSHRPASRDRVAIPSPGSGAQAKSSGSSYGCASVT